MENKNTGKAPAEWYERNRTNPDWWRKENYWNVSCKTCEFNIDGHCAGSCYGKPVSELPPEYAKECKEWGISFDAWKDEPQDFQNETYHARLKAWYSKD